jgi:hypothetical protein
MLALLRGPEGAIKKQAWVIISPVILEGADHGVGIHLSEVRAGDLVWRWNEVGDESTGLQGTGQDRLQP